MDSAFIAGPSSGKVSSQSSSHSCSKLQSADKISSQNDLASKSHDAVLVQGVEDINDGRFEDDVSKQPEPITTRLSKHKLKVKNKADSEASNSFHEKLASSSKSVGIVGKWTLQKVAKQIINQKRRDSYIKTWGQADIQQDKDLEDENYLLELKHIILSLLQELAPKLSINEKLGRKHVTNFGPTTSANFVGSSTTTANSDNFSIVDFLLQHPGEILNLDLTHKDLTFIAEQLQIHESEYTQNLSDVVKETELSRQTSVNNQTEDNSLTLSIPVSSNTSTDHVKIPTVTLSSLSTSATTNESSVDALVIDDLTAQQATESLSPENSLPGTSGSTRSQPTTLTRPLTIQQIPPGLGVLASVLIAPNARESRPADSAFQFRNIYLGVASILNPGVAYNPVPDQPQGAPNRRRRLRPTSVQHSTGVVHQPLPQPLVPATIPTPAERIPGVQPQNHVLNRLPNQILALPAPILTQIRAFTGVDRQQAPVQRQEGRAVEPPPPPPPPPPLPPQLPQPGHHIRPPQAHEAAPPRIQQQHLHQPPLSPPVPHRRLSHVYRRHSSFTR